MNPINKKTVSSLLVHGEELGNRLLISKPLKKIQKEGLVYMPEQLSGDMVQVSRSGAKTKILLEKLSQLAEMRKSGMTHQAIAEYFGMSRPEIQAFMKKYMPDVKKELTELNQVIVQYCLPASKVEQEQAFAIIDRYLQKLAKEAMRNKGGISYEDCLQDARLRFLEIVENRTNKQKVNPSNVLKMLNKTKFSVQQEIETVGLKSLEGMDEKLSETDLGIEILEINDYIKYIVDTRMSQREKDILKMYLQDGESEVAIGNAFNLCKFRVKQIVTMGSRRLTRLYTYLNSGGKITPGMIYRGEI